MEITFIGDNQFKKFLKLSKSKLTFLIKYFEALHYIESPSTICVKIVSEKEIKFLNKKFRKKNKITDVISFEDEGFSGDIAITDSYVNKNGKFLEQNFFMLLVHGILHLFGYTHYDIKNRKSMRLLENIAMINLDLKKTHEI